MRGLFISMVLTLAVFASNGAYASANCYQNLVNKGWQAWAFTIVDTGVTGKLMVQFRSETVVHVKVLVDNNPGKSWAASNERWGVGDGFVQVVYNTKQNPNPSQPYRMTLHLNERCAVYRVKQVGGGREVKFR